MRTLLNQSACTFNHYTSYTSHTLRYNKQTGYNSRHYAFALSIYSWNAISPDDSWKIRSIPYGIYSPFCSAGIVPHNSQHRSNSGWSHKRGHVSLRTRETEPTPSLPLFPFHRLGSGNLFPPPLRSTTGCAILCTLLAVKKKLLVVVAQELCQMYANSARGAWGPRTSLAPAREVPNSRPVCRITSASQCERVLLTPLGGLREKQDCVRSDANFMSGIFFQAFFAKRSSNCNQKGQRTPDSYFAGRAYCASK